MAQDNILTPPELRDDNPYFTGVVSVFDDGSVALDPGDFNYQKSDQDRYYTVIDEENLNAISFKAYGNAKLWHILAKVNNIFNPFELESGSTLLIPDLDHVQFSNL